MVHLTCIGYSGSGEVRRGRHEIITTRLDSHPDDDAVLALQLPDDGFQSRKQPTLSFILRVVLVVWPAKGSVFRRRYNQTIGSACGGHDSIRFRPPSRVWMVR